MGRGASTPEAALQITGVSPIAVTVPTAREPMSFCFVRVDTEDGSVGYGEACDSYCCTYADLVGTALAQAYRPLLLGSELTTAADVAATVDRLRDATRRRLGDAGVAVQALSAVELALWDALGRLQGASVSRLLGRVRDRVPVYASWTFLEEGPAPWHHEQLAPWLQRGVRMVKVRVGPQWQADLATLAELRALLPDVELMVDGSETFTLPTARRIADVLADLGVTWFEEPLPQHARAGIRELARRSRVPLAYGEHLYGVAAAQDALAHGEFSVLQPDPAVAGGIVVARRMAEVGAYHGVRVAPHICAGPVALAAGLQLAGSTSVVQAVEYPLHLVPIWQQLAPDLAVGPDAIDAGTIAIPDGPGLGARLDEAAAAANPYRSPGTRVAGTAHGLPDRFVGRV
jgi:L-alanine-DL-glutamate epimerase-like enolase superfamily enzyme